MNLETWFSTPIWNTVLDVLENKNQQAIDFCLNLKAESAGRKKSNAGGWQSEDLFEPDFANTPLAFIFDKLHILCQQAIKDLGSKKNVKITNFWVNINGKGDSNRPHDHPHSILSCVFYLTDNNSNIVFTRQRDVFNYFLQNIHSSFSTPLSFTQVTYTPVKNVALIFPSWLMHYVEENTTDQDRISIAFNVTVE